MVSIEQLIIEENTTIKKAMEQLDTTAKRILFIAPEGKLKAVITDGDIRRHLIKNGSLENQVSSIATYRPIYITRENKRFVGDIMRKHSIFAIPQVDDQGIIEAVLFADDVDLFREVDLDIPVVINAGGFGTRLFPYTKILPKALIPIGEQPIITIIMKRFEQYGCNDFHVIVNHKKNLIKAFFADSPQKSTIDIIDEHTPLGTGGGLSLLKEKIKGTFFFSNCDILVDADYGSMYRQHKKDENIITMVCALKDIVIPYGVVNMSKSGKIDSFTEKPQFSFLTNTGLYIVESEVIDNLVNDKSISFPEIMEYYWKSGRNVGVYPVSDNAWMDMGQLEELEAMRKRFEKGE